MSSYDELFEPFDDKLFKCQWKECRETFDDFAYFFSHCRREHSTDYLDWSTVCGWRGCEQNGFESIDKLYTHMTIHIYYYKIMSDGYKVLKSVGFDKAMCHLDSSTRCDISVFPTKEFICAWKDCNGQFNDYNLFVQHTGYHAIEDVTIPLVAKEKLRKIRFAQCCWFKCDKNFKTKTHLKTHLLSHSYGRNYACPVCGTGFINKAQFLNHCYRQKVSISVENDACSSSKKRSIALEKEEYEDSVQRPKEDNKKTAMGSCDNAEESLTNSADTYPCPHCTKVFDAQQLYRQHLARHERKHPCPECDYIAPYPSNLKAHIKYKHSKERDFPCKFCPAKFKTYNDLVRHVHLHSNPQTNNTCEICGKSYTTPYSLKRHMLEHTAPSSFKYRCETCKECYDSLEIITEHLRTLACRNAQAPTSAE